MIIFGIHLFASDIWLLSICGALIMALIGYRLILSTQRHSAFNIAATAFRNKTLNALEGIYPVTKSWWDEATFPIFRESISKIETAGAEFSHFIKRKAELDVAVKKYHEYCERGTYQKGTPRLTYPNSPELHKDEINPTEEFKNIVEHLLSFTE